MASVAAKPWRVEYAKSATSSCKTCMSTIDEEELMLGEMVQSSQFDGVVPMWNHADCIMRKVNQIKLVDDVEGLELLQLEDQQKIRKYVEGCGPSAKNSFTPPGCNIEVSLTSRVACQKCGQKIMKGDMRVSTEPDGRGVRGVKWYHASCFVKMSTSIQLDKLSGWDILPAFYQSTLRSWANNVPSANSGIPSMVSFYQATLLSWANNLPSADSGNEHELRDKEVVQESTSRAGTKRKKDVIGILESKVFKAEGNVSASWVASSRNAGKSGSEDAQVAELESEMEAQTKELWALIEDLKKHVTTSEMREMLEVNGQDSTGYKLDLRERCADGMLFGALTSCPLCSGSLRYFDGMYRCHGYLSAGSKCSYSTQEPERVKGKWKIPKGTENWYLIQWFKLQEGTKRVQILPPSSVGSPIQSEVYSSQSEPSSERLGDLKVSIVGSTKKSITAWKSKIEEAGGQLHVEIMKDTSCLVVAGQLDGENAEIRMARRMKLPIVREDYLIDCFERQKKLQFDLYKVEAHGKASDGVIMKIKGRSAVHESSGLQDSGHILEDGESIYSATLNMSDLSTGANRYYILQIIQEDRGSGCYLFRKWGCELNEKIRGSKLCKLSKSDAIHEFKRLFSIKTGNPWEAWESKENFQKRPGRFYPLDIDNGVNKQVRKKIANDAECQLATPLEQPVRVLFEEEFEKWLFEQCQPIEELEEGRVGGVEEEEEDRREGGIEEEAAGLEEVEIVDPAQVRDVTVSMEQGQPTEVLEEGGVGGKEEDRREGGRENEAERLEEDEIVGPIVAVSSLTLNENAPAASISATPCSSGVDPARVRDVSVSMEQGQPTKELQEGTVGGVEEDSRVGAREEVERLEEDETVVPGVAVLSLKLNEDVLTASSSTLSVNLHSTGVDPDQVRGGTVSAEQASVLSSMVENCGVNKLVTKKIANDADCRLAAPLTELMRKEENKEWLFKQCHSTKGLEEQRVGGEEEDSREGGREEIEMLEEDETAAVLNLTLNEDVPTASNSGLVPALVGGVTVSVEQAPGSNSPSSSSIHHVSSHVSHRMAELLTLLGRGGNALMNEEDLFSVTRLLDLEIKESAHPSMMRLLSELRETSEKIGRIPEEGIDLEKSASAKKSAAEKLAEEKKLFEGWVQTAQTIEERRAQNKAELVSIEEQIETLQAARQGCLRVEKVLAQDARNIDDCKEKSAARMLELLVKLEEVKKDHDINSSFVSILIRHFNTLVNSLSKLLQIEEETEEYN